MPELLWLSLTALLYNRTSASCGALAEALETVSHDRLTRLLQAEWSGHTLLELAFRTLCVWQCGYLIIDDTVSPALDDGDGGPGVGLLQPRAPARVWLLLGAARVDRWATSDAFGPVPLAPRGPFYVHVGLGVTQLGP
jgi:hypothetical protein